jgi:dihydroneopterin aldolase/2-amino-4-hydroxy-6-hydroxymethyldihydropteridine diphosphokinase
MDKIKIKDLEVYCYHGVLKEENILGQKFLVSATLYTNIQKSGKTDDIVDSINYAEVAHFIKKFMENNMYKLIEAVVEHMAHDILVAFPLVEKIKLKIKKPWAPILLPIDTVSVEAKRKWHRVYLGIGSNLGDKEDNLNQAIRYLNEDEECMVTKVSDFIVTKPVGEVEQDDFLNGALELRTLKSPDELLNFIHEIEKALKRERLIHWGPRTIDLDILFYDKKIIESGTLTIPHPEMHKREFVLEPLSNIAPEVMHPGLHKTVNELRKKL